MKKDPVLFLKHIIECIERIEKFTVNVNLEKFVKDDLIHSAVNRQLEIIGEAVKNIPITYKQKYTSVPWKEIAGTRDKLIHQYFGVDLNFIYDIIVKHIPKLKKEMKKILKEEEK